jgi:amino acid transporter
LTFFTQLEKLVSSIFQKAFFADSTQVNAVFSFAGVETVSVAAAETKSPRQNIPKACKRVFARVFIFYLCAVLIVGVLVPSNDPSLGNETGNASQSPFVIVAVRAGISGTFLSDI